MWLHDTFAGTEHCNFNMFCSSTKLRTWSSSSMRSKVETVFTPFNIQHFGHYVLMHLVVTRDDHFSWRIPMSRKNIITHSAWSYRHQLDFTIEDQIVWRLYWHVIDDYVSSMSDQRLWLLNCPLIFIMKFVFYCQFRTFKYCNSTSYFFLSISLWVGCCYFNTDLKKEKIYVKIYFLGLWKCLWKCLCT